MIGLQGSKPGGDIISRQYYCIHERIRESPLAQGMLRYEQIETNEKRTTFSLANQLCGPLINTQSLTYYHSLGIFAAS